MSPISIVGRGPTVTRHLSVRRLPLPWSMGSPERCCDVGLTPSVAVTTAGSKDPPVKSNEIQTVGSSDSVVEFTLGEGD
jgi:hypothetical protein